MAVTSIYMGSLRYSMNGKKRKNHCANPTRRKTPIVTKQRKPSQSELDRIQASKEHREKYPSLMEQQIKNGTFGKQPDSMGRKGERRIENVKKSLIIKVILDRLFIYGAITTLV